MPTALRTPRVAIIGAGMSGIGMAAKLSMAGIDTFHLYEQWDDIGGTWHANRYPGLSCDVASRFYQYTFAPNPNWSHMYSGGREIWRYLDEVAARFGIREKTSLSTRVAEARWDAGVWRLRTEAGEQADYDFIVTATGGLVVTRTPDIPGLADFEGAAFHSAEWDESVPLAGKRVAVIGTGSTGVQITRALAPVTARFELYQRTPQWILPVANRRYSHLARSVLRRAPGLNLSLYRSYQRFYEWLLGVATVQPGLRRRYIQWQARRHLTKVKDPELRRRFTPDDEPMCKRMIMATDFYEQFERPTVDLVDIGIDHIEARGIVTTDGVLHEQDVIVLATGFDAHAFVRPMELVGPGGARLSELWASEPFGYRTVGLPGFPNVFMLIGPHSPFGNQSLFAISETQQDFTLGVIDEWRRGEIDAISPTREATERFNDDVRAAVPNTVWATGCDSWYIGKDGLPVAWPWTPGHHRDVLAERVREDWEAVPG